MLCDVCATGEHAPYAMGYQDGGGTQPWKTLLVDGYTKAPWLHHLPPKANGSLHGFGFVIFSQTPACKMGRINAGRYGQWVRDVKAWRQHTSSADTLIKCCAAFAHSPLSIVIDKRATLQCISLAVKHLLTSKSSALIVPSDVEIQLYHVCAAGCGKDLRDDTGQRWHNPAYGNSLEYCSAACASAVSAALCLHRQLSRDASVSCFKFSG